MADKATELMTAGYQPWPDYDFALRCGAYTNPTAPPSLTAGQLDALIVALRLIRTPDEPIVAER